MAGCFKYLENIKLAEEIQSTVRFFLYDFAVGVRNNMILDSSAL